MMQNKKQSVSGQWGMSRLVQSDRKPMETEITILYNHSEQISECTTSEKDRLVDNGSTSQAD